MNYKFNISGFTHVGTVRKDNQDRIFILDRILSEGSYTVKDVDACFCFVADGIGGGAAGDFAADFVLENIRKETFEGRISSREHFSKLLKRINLDLLQAGKVNTEYYGSGTTLAGLVIMDREFWVVNVGDSVVYALRKKSLIKLTTDHVFDQFENNSPITSYFGGKSENLEIDFNTPLRNIQPHDIFLIASDGLLKSLENKHVKAILSTSRSLQKKMQFLREKVLASGGDDNVSSILIEVLG